MLVASPSTVAVPVKPLAYVFGPSLTGPLHRVAFWQIKRMIDIVAFQLAGCSLPNAARFPVAGRATSAASPRPQPCR